MLHLFVFSSPSSDGRDVREGDEYHRTNNTGTPTTRDVSQTPSTSPELMQRSRARANEEHPPINTTREIALSTGDHHSVQKRDQRPQNSRRSLSVPRGETLPQLPQLSVTQRVLKQDNMRTRQEQEDRERALQVPKALQGLHEPPRVL